MAIVAVIGGMLVALYVASSVLMSEGNQLASLFFYLMVGSGVMGIMAPRFTFTVFILQGAYLDLLKRMLVMDGRVDFTDLFWVLGIAPVTVVSIAAGLLLRVVFGSERADASDIKRLIIAVLLNAVLGAYVFFKLGGGIGGTLREVANGSTYTLLLFIVPLLFSTAESVAKCARFIILVYVPVCAYGIYQQLFGYQEFEIAYLKTGLSMEIKQLENDRVRAFGTLNSPTSLAVVATSLAAMALSLMMTGGKRFRQWLNVPVTIVLSVIFIGGWAASTVRVGILLLPVAMIGMHVFRSGKRTRLFYLVLGVAFLILVASSNYLYANLELWTRALVNVVGDSGYIFDMINLNSYKDRVYGFANVLANPSAYTFFGMGTEEEQKAQGYAAHDPISNALLSMGIVPLALLLVLSVWGLRKFHRVVYDMTDAPLQRLAAGFLANAVGNLVVTLVNGNLLTSFPVNVFFWICIAFAASLRRADEKLAEMSVDPLPSPVRAGPAFRPGMLPPMAIARRRR